MTSSGETVWSADTDRYLRDNWQEPKKRCPSCTGMTFHFPDCSREKDARIEALEKQVKVASDWISELAKKSAASSMKHESRIDQIEMLSIELEAEQNQLRERRAVVRAQRDEIEKLTAACRYATANWNEQAEMIREIRELLAPDQWDNQTVELIAEVVA